MPSTHSSICLDEPLPPHPQLPTSPPLPYPHCSQCCTLQTRTCFSYVCLQFCKFRKANKISEGNQYFCLFVCFCFNTDCCSFLQHCSLYGITNVQTPDPLWANNRCHAESGQIFATLLHDVGDAVHVQARAASLTP